MFWLAIFFAILYFGIVRLTLPKLGRVITARENRVTSDIDTAGRAKAEADRISAAYDAEVAAAQEEARARLGEAKSAATKALELRLAASNELLKQQAGKAELALDAARVRAMGEIEAVVVDAAADIVERMTGTRPVSNDINAVRMALG